MEIKTITKNTNSVTKKEFDLDEFFNNIKNIITEISPYIDSETDRQIQDLKNMEDNIQKTKEVQLKQGKSEIEKITDELNKTKLKNELLKTIHYISNNDSISVSEESRKQLLELLEHIEKFSNDVLISKNEILKNTIRRLGI